MTRQDLLTRIRQMSDTLYATVDYPDELLKDMASMVHADEWRKILGAAPYYRTATVTPTLDAQRTFPLTALSSGTGNTRQKFNRVLEMTDEHGRAFTFAQADRLRLVNTSSVVTNDHLWTRVGDRVQVYGVGTGAIVHVLVNWTPTPVGDLTSDADTVDWLEDWKPILFYEIAGHVLAKGGRETNEARDLMAMAERLRSQMLAGVVRDSASPYVLGANDHPWEWGG